MTFPQLIGLAGLFITSITINTGLLKVFTDDKFKRPNAVSLIINTLLSLVGVFFGIRLIGVSYLVAFVLFNVLSFLLIFYFKRKRTVQGLDLGKNLESEDLEKETISAKEKPRIEINGSSISGNIIIGSSGGHIQVDDKTDEVYVELKKLLSAIGKKFFKISIGHPQLISKGYESPFVVQLYFEELSDNVKMRIKRIIGEKYTERVYNTELKLGQVVKIKLFSPDITFPEPIAKKLDSSVNSMTFLGKPLEACQPGEHKIVLSILDNKTGIEFQSETFAIKVSDFAFDHVSRPLLSKVSATILGIGSFTMFILTLFEQIDKTIGFTSGTAAGVLAAVVYTNFYNLYQRIRPNTP